MVSAPTELCAQPDRRSPSRHGVLDADQPQVVEDGRGICGHLRADGRPLIEGIRRAARAVGLHDQLHRALAVHVDNAVSVPAENERAVHVQKADAPILVTLSGMVILFISEQDMKALAPILVTPLSILTVLMDLRRSYQGEIVEMSFVYEAISPFPLMVSTPSSSSVQVTFSPQVPLSDARACAQTNNPASTVRIRIHFIPFLIRIGLLSDIFSLFQRLICV